VIIVGKQFPSLGDDVAPGPFRPQLSPYAPPRISTAVAPAPVVYDICSWRKEGRTEEQVVRMLRRKYPGLSDAQIVQAQSEASQMCPTDGPPASATTVPEAVPELPLPPQPPAPQQPQPPAPQQPQDPALQPTPVVHAKMHFAWWVVPLTIGVGLGFALGKRS